MWLYLPISVSSRAPEDSTLPSDSLFQRLAASVMWRSSFRRPRFWQRALKTVPWMRLLSGVTSEPSQANSIVAGWLEQFLVSPARISLSRESKKEWSKATDQDSSTPPCESFAQLDASGCFLKTSPQFSLFPRDTPYSENLPKAGSMRNGCLFERSTLELRTGESGSSSWPTARAADSESCGNHPGAQDSLGGVTANWGTPRVTTNNGTPNASATGKESRIEDQAVEFWKTPHGMGNIDASGKHGGGGGGEFAKQANAWTTPQAHDSGGGRPRPG
jgi:hypothetical protein